MGMKTGWLAKPTQFHCKGFSVDGKKAANPEALDTPHALVETCPVHSAALIAEPDVRWDSWKLPFNKRVEGWSA